MSDQHHQPRRGAWARLRCLNAYLDDSLIGDAIGAVCLAGLFVALMFAPLLF